jgi:hypothetical protein
VFKCNGREDNLIQFNSHKNIAIKKMRENKRRDQIRTQDENRVRITMSIFSRLPTSNNWGWVLQLKTIR